MAGGAGGGCSAGALIDSQMMNDRCNGEREGKDGPFYCECRFRRGKFLPGADEAKEPLDDPLGL